MNIFTNEIANKINIENTYQVNWTPPQILNSNMPLESTQECYKAASPLLKKIMDAVVSSAENGTVPASLIGTLNDANKIEIAVKGEAIFKQMADIISQADHEVLLQTFVWDNKIPGIQRLNDAFQEVAKRKQSQGCLQPLRVYILIDERGALANVCFNGRIAKKWPCTPQNLGLYSAPGLVEIYPATFHHNSFKGNHAKTLVVDGKALVITGANFQASNFGHIPAHDASLLMRGPIAQAARADFIETWNSLNRREENPCFPFIQELPFFEEPLAHQEHPVPVLFVSRKAQSAPVTNPYDNPLTNAFLSAIDNAQQKIQIATPNLNAPAVIHALVNFINKRGGVIELLLSKGFNDSREVMPGLGGTNQYTVDTLFKLIDDDKIQNLKVKWFSLDGQKPVLANVAGASHLKFMAIDGQLTIFGNANLDKISLTLLHEDNVVIDDKNTTKNFTEKVFSPVFNQSIEAKPSENILEANFEYLGIKGLQEKLASTTALKIQQIDDEGAGYKTFHFERPPEWNFIPGQYVEIRSGNILSSFFKQPAILAIASGTSDRDIQITARSSMMPWHSNRALHRGAGQFLEITGPIGTSFPMDQITASTEVLLIGGGSGLTVIKSLMNSLPKHTTIDLSYSAKTQEDVLYPEEVRQWAKKGHFISLTQEKVEGFEEGRVTDHLKFKNLNINTLAFICGPTELIKAVIKVLVDKGLDRKQIFASLPVGAKEGGPVFRADHPKLL